MLDEKNFIFFFHRNIGLAEVGISRSHNIFSLRNKNVTRSSDKENNFKLP